MPRRRKRATGKMSEMGKMQRQDFDAMARTGKRAPVGLPNGGRRDIGREPVKLVSGATEHGRGNRIDLTPPPRSTPVRREVTPRPGTATSVTRGTGRTTVGSRPSAAARGTGAGYGVDILAPTPRKRGG